VGISGASQFSADHTVALKGPKPVERKPGLLQRPARVMLSPSFDEGVLFAKGVAERLQCVHRHDPRDTEVALQI
jgi:hypothetical protein